MMPFHRKAVTSRRALLALTTCCLSIAAIADSSETVDSDTTEPQKRHAVTPDVREDDLKVKIKKHNFVAVPIPVSNPTLGTGLVVGAGYFYPQTEEQKKSQPASVTGAGGLYTSNHSYAYALGQESYWGGDAWRFTGAVGYADLQLTLLSPDTALSGLETDWLVSGTFVYSEISRRLARSSWYAGVYGRFVDIDQDIVINLPASSFELPSEIKSSGLGLSLTHDARDLPTNAYEGHYFQINALFNEQSLGSDNNYQSYSGSFRSYHKVAETVILAWEVAGCGKSGKTPLWDACRIGLRGFAATDYMGKGSVRGQFEARWIMSKRWGLVGFAGAGQITDSFSGLSDRETIPSYGVGLRFMVMQSQRINLRLDYGRSNNSDAIYLAIGEAF